MFFTPMSTGLVILSLVLGTTAQSFTGKATYHTEWASNACDGQPKDGTNFVTAMNPAQYGDGLGNHSPVCGNTITVTFEGKSAVVTVIDMGGVGAGGLDLSIAAFEYFQPLCKGFFYPTWSWNDYVPGTGVQNVAGLKAVAATSNATVAYTVPQACEATEIPSSTSAVPTTSKVSSAVVPPVAGATSVVSSDPAVPTVPAVSSMTAPTTSVIPAVPAVSSVAESATPIASVAPTAVAAPASTGTSAVASIVPAVSASTPVAAISTRKPRPSGHGGHRGGRGRRCAASLI